MFNDVQNDLLIRARQRIEEGTERFVCCAINTAVSVVGISRYDECASEGRRLKEQIEFGIDNYTCMELWLFSETGIYPEDLQDVAHNEWKKYAFVGWNTPLSRDAFNNLCRMARLAWIDRMLDNNEVK